MPALGQSVEEASITAWLKNEGDPVKTGEPICTIQTDKAEIECESTATGILRKILVEPDVFVAVMTPIALVGEADEAIPDSVGGAPAAASAAAAAAPSAPEPAPEPAAAPAAPAESSSAPAASAAAPGAPVSPRARAAAHELHVDPSLVAGSGVGGRVMEADVQAFAADGPKATSTAKRVAAQAGVDLRGVEGTGVGGRITKDDVAARGTTTAPAAAPAAAAVPVAPSGLGTVTPLTPMRKIIAQRMSESKFTAPHYYVSIEVDMKEAVAFRGAQTSFKPSFNDLVLRGVVRAIQKVPAVNARWLGDSIEVLPDINLGVAVALPTGLVVPVIRQAQTKSLQDISRESRALGEKAKNNKLLPDDYQGNTFTVSNMGVYGIDHFTAIINQPDSAILAVGAIKDQVVAINGGICIRPRMMMTISSDHRVIDGAVAAQFMAALKEVLEAADF